MNRLLSVAGAALLAVPAALTALAAATCPAMAITIV